MNDVLAFLSGGGVGAGLFFGVMLAFQILRAVLVGSERR